MKLKRKYVLSKLGVILLILTMAAACVMAACGDNGEGGEQLPTMFEVFFDLNNGRAVDSCESDFDTQIIEKGEFAAIPASAPLRDGYWFKGWLTSDGNEFNFELKITKNTTIKAGWIALISVAFDLDGGEGDGDYSSQTFLSGTRAEKPADPQKAEHMFNGWIDGAGVFDFDREIYSSEPLTINLKANWKPIEYELSYYIDNVPFYSETYAKSNQTTHLRTPQMVGYVLDCWYANADFEGEKQTYIPALETGDKVFYGRWLAVITVEFDWENGITEQQIPSGGTINPFENPKRSGYIFIEWLDKDGNPFDFDGILESNTPKTIRLTARWIALITVKFDISNSDSDSKDFEDQVFLSGEKAQKPADPVRDGYVFKGWFKDGVPFDFETEIFSDTPLEITLKSDWYLALQNVTVVFDLKGGHSLQDCENDFDDRTIEQGHNAAIPASDPQREGYAFKGWLDSNDDAFDFDCGIFMDTVIYAAWNALITVSFDLNGGAGNFPDQIFESGEYAVKPVLNPSREDYDFINWLNKDEESFNFDVPITSKATLLVTVKAEWAAVITVIFDIGGGKADTEFTTYTLTSGVHNFAKPTAEPTRDGYVFNGWAVNPINILEGNENWEPFVILSRIPLIVTVKAQWLALIKIVFYLNGGEDENDYPEQIIITGETALKPKIDPQKVYCDFTGWYTDEDGEKNLFDFDTPLNKNVTLYAGWKLVDDWFEFIFEDGRWAVALGKAKPDKDGKLVIPGFNPANGEVITAIAARGFSRGDFIVSEIKEIVLPNSIICIGERAFYGCSGLEKIILPYGLKYLRKGAFTYCWALKSIEIPALQEMGAEVFYGCLELVTVIFNVDFNVLILPNSTFFGCRILTSVTLPPCLKEIGDYAFYTCFGLENLVIPSSVTHIGAGALWGSEVKKIILPQGLLSIGAENDESGVFGDCKNITHIFIPSTVRFVGEHAFSGWNYFQTIHIQGKTQGWDPNWYKNSKSPAIHYDCECGSFKQDSFVVTFITTPPDHSAIPTAYLIAAQGEPIIPPMPDVQDYYTFAGWHTLNGEKFDFNSPITGHFTLISRWEIEYYTVTYYLDGGENHAENPESYTFLDSFDLFSPDKDGYKFDGWYGNSAFTGQKITSIAAGESGGKEFFAKWLRLYTVTFDARGGIPAPPEQIITEGNKAQMPTAPALGGYDFMGWFTAAEDGEKFHFNAPITADITLYSHWTKEGEDPEEEPEPEYSQGLVYVRDKNLNGYAVSFDAASYDGDGKIVIPPVNPNGGGAVVAIAQNGFANIGVTEVVLPRTITHIYEGAFRNCIELKKINLNQGLKYIAARAFFNCASLEFLLIPSSVTLIESADKDKDTDGAFACSGLKSIEFAEGIILKKLGAYAFHKCLNLNKVEIKGVIEEVGDYCFALCTALEFIELPQGLLKIGESAFGDKDKKMGLKEVILHEGLLCIGDNAFMNCTEIESFSIPASVIKMGLAVFSGFTAAQTVYVLREIESDIVLKWHDNWMGYNPAYMIVYALA